MLNYNYFNCLLPGKPQNVGFVSLGLRRYENRRFFSAFYARSQKEVIHMFREMRRKRQALPQEICDAVLRRGTSGVLALSGDDGYPYAVPISYIYDGEKLYFHSARQGHKLDAIGREWSSLYMLEMTPEHISGKEAIELVNRSADF